jgi:hypothetical protein
MRTNQFYTFRITGTAKGIANGKRNQPESLYLLIFRKMCSGKQGIFFYHSLMERTFQSKGINLNFV